MARRRSLALTLALTLGTSALAPVALLTAPTAQAVETISFGPNIPAVNVLMIQGDASITNSAGAVVPATLAGSKVVRVTVGTYSSSGALTGITLIRGDGSTVSGTRSGNTATFNLTTGLTTGESLKARANFTPTAGYSQIPIDTGGSSSVCFSGSCTNFDATRLAVTFSAETAPAPATPPTIALNALAPNSASWYNRPVTVSAICTAGSSPIASCTPDQTFLEGTSTFTFTATDANGLTASRPFTARVDLTPPNIATPNLSDVRLGDTIRFNASDTLSGVASVSGSGPLATEGVVDSSGVSYTAKTVGSKAGSVGVTDYAGNYNTQRFSWTVKHDAPVVRVSTSLQPNANGWFNKPVVATTTTTFDRNSTPAGFQEQTRTFDADGIRYTYFESVTDSFGYQANAPETQVKVDLTPPTGGLAQSGNIFFVSANDTFSGVDKATYQIDDGPEVLGGIGTLPVGTHKVTLRVTDKAGNVFETSSVMTRDHAAPTAKRYLSGGTLGNDGWYKAVPTVKTECATSDDATIDCPADTTLSSEGLVTLPVQTLTDQYGSSVTLPELSFRLDTVAPEASLADRDPLSKTANIVATDATSGVDTISYSLDGGDTYQNGAEVPLAVGVNNVTVRVTDVAGNETVKTFQVDRAHNLPTAQRVVTGGEVGDDGWYKKAPVVSYECEAFDGATLDCPKDEVPQEGVNTFAELTVKDSLGGEVVVPAGEVKLDTVGPEVTLDGVKDQSWQWGYSVDLSIKAADSTSGVKELSYTVDGGVAQSDENFTVQGVGTHTVEYTAKDAAGNITAGKISFTLGGNPPAPKKGVLERVKRIANPTPHVSNAPVLPRGERDVR